MYQTHYVPIGVVPPQEANIRNYQNQELNQQVQFVQIPVNKDVQLPQYIKTVVPLTVDQNLKKSDRKEQKVTSRFASTEIQADEEKKDPNAEIAALEFVRYVNQQNDDILSDTVIIDAKTENVKKEEENTNDSEGKNELVIL